MRQERIVNLYPSVLWAIMGAVFMVWSQMVSNEWMFGFLFLIMAVMFAAALSNFLIWLAYRSLLIYEHYRKVANETWLSRLADSLHGLTNNQMNVLHGVIFDEPIDPEEPITQINGVDIPDRWIIAHLSRSKGQKLEPIRNYSGGSKSRDYARLLEDFLVSKGAAVKGKGNKSARVYSWKKVTEALEWD